MSSGSEERVSSPDKAPSSSSPPDIYSSPENNEESIHNSQQDEDEDSSCICNISSLKCAAQDDEEPNHHQETRDENSGHSRLDDEYFRPIKKLRMVNVRQEPAAPSQQKPLTSFFIKDILSHKSSSPSLTHQLSGDRGIVRPWDIGSPASLTAATSRRRPRSAEDDSRSEKSESDSSQSPAGLAVNSSPLDALFEMTSKAFEGLDADEKATDPTRDHLNLFSSRQQPKKKRKSRTAFTNHQIFELEKRFLYQKYLSPADRDEIAQSLGLTNAQVITWFQNRRAKLKRDMEELKKDVDAAKVTGHRALLESIHGLNTSKQTLSKSPDSFKD